MADRILTRTERAAARLCTGPLAHLVAGVIDVVAVLAHLGRERWRARHRDSPARR